MEPGRLSPSRGPPGGCGGSFAPPRSLRRLLLAALPPTVRAAAPHFSFTARPIPLYPYRPTLIPAAPTVIPALTPSFPRKRESTPRIIGPNQRYATTRPTPIQPIPRNKRRQFEGWIPACAGMTVWRSGSRRGGNVWARQRAGMAMGWEWWGGGAGGNGAAGMLAGGNGGELTGCSMRPGKAVRQGAAFGSGGKTTTPLAAVSHPAGLFH